MNETSTNSKLLYSILAGISVIGTIILAIFSKVDMIAGFLLGVLVTAGVITTVIMTMKALYSTGGEKSALVRLLSGPIPKLVLMVGGILLCKSLPNIFSMLGYVIGLAMYAFVFIGVSIIEFFKTK